MNAVLFHFNVVEKCIRMLRRHNITLMFKSLLLESLDEFDPRLRLHTDQESVQR